MPDYRSFYEPVRRYFYEKQSRINVLKLVYRTAPQITAAIYILMLAFLFITHDAHLLRAAAYPCIVFVLASLFRKCFNRPRPYEGADAITPVITKDKKGQSFPSRHALSAAVIASACIYVYMPLGIAAAVLSVIIAVTRVLAGVHYPSDVIGGLVAGYGLCAVLFIFI